MVFDFQSLKLQSLMMLTSLDYFGKKGDNSEDVNDGLLIELSGLFLIMLDLSLSLYWVMEGKLSLNCTSYSSPAVFLSLSCINVSINCSGGVTKECLSTSSYGHFKIMFARSGSLG